MVGCVDIGIDEEDISAAHSPPQAPARVPCPDADPGRARHPGSETGQEARAPVGLRRTNVRRVIAEGKTRSGERVVLYVAPSAGTPKAAFVASRKVGGAVDRNRARRIMRAAWRELAPQVRDGTEIVFVARGTIQGARTQDIQVEMEDLLRRAGVVKS
jgi:ribonuclease P protein component